MGQGVAESRDMAVAQPACVVHLELAFFKREGRLLLEPESLLLRVGSPPNHSVAESPTQQTVARMGS